MTCNIGKTDRIIRIVLGLVIMLLGYMYSNWLGLIGLVPLLTASVKWCPLYLPFGINTSKKESSNESQ